MRPTILRTTLRALIALCLAAISLTGTSAAQANTAWISGPSLNSVSLVGIGAAKTGTGYSLSSQASEFTLTYTSSSASAGKFAQVNFFEIASGLQVILTATPMASPTGCEQQVLAGDSHSCMFKLDGNGSAAIKVTLIGTSVSSSFKYILLSGPNIAQTEPGIATFVAPKSAVKAVVASVKALAGGASVVRFKLTDGAKPSVGVKVNVTLKGIGDNLSVNTATSDSKGMVWVYVANTGAKKGTSTVTVAVDGTQAKGSATIKWVSGTLGN
jgi:hypothetical protein